MSKLTLAVFVVLVWTSVAQAQDTPVADVAVGYGFIEVPQGFTFMMHGGNAAVALRPQVEYFGFRAKGVTTTTARLSIGIVFRIGKKA